MPTPVRTRNPTPRKADQIQPGYEVSKKQAAKETKKLQAAAALARSRGDYSEAHQLLTAARELMQEAYRAAA